MLTFEKGVQALQDAGKKITAQRRAIIELLVDYAHDHYHPSAEEIFTELKKKNISSLSMATVYSTTQLLAEKLVIRILPIDDKKIYIEPETASHGHFMCTVCKKILNVPIGCMDTSTSMKCQRHMSVPLNPNCMCAGDVRSVSEISSVTKAEVLLYGICAECAESAGNEG